jgi:hypothetical protein
MNPRSVFKKTTADAARKTGRRCQKFWCGQFVGVSVGDVTDAQVRVAKQSSFAFNGADITRTLGNLLILPNVGQLSAPPHSRIKTEISSFGANSPGVARIRARFLSL